MVAAASLARLVSLCAALWVGSVAAQQLPAAGSAAMKASGLLQLGRVAFALPPGEWQVLPMQDIEIRKTDYSCRCERTQGLGDHNPVQHAFAVQVDPVTRQLRTAMYFRASQSTIPVVRVWLTSACEARSPPLHKDGMDGNFNYPACLTIEAVEGPSAGPQQEIETWFWDWMKANGVEIPHTLLAAKYLKYGTGEHVWALLYVNPNVYGISPTAQGNRGEWSLDAVKADPQKTEYLAKFKAWSYRMAKESRLSLVDRKPKEPGLPAIPSM
ncbi:MAG TPA: hypothetical protein VN663_15110 [Ramlibacter sp.]|nr:hypothetical protein [Ramlibacter sp.]